jgi:ketopantoate reductase
MQIHDGRSPGDNSIAWSQHSGRNDGKTTELQDLERGRTLEIDALVTAVQEMRRLVKVATPMIDTVLALAQERGRQGGLYGKDAQR